MSLVRAVAVLLALSALVTTGAVAHGRGTSSSVLSQAKSCVVVGVISDPGSQKNTLAGSAADSCSCPPSPYNPTYPHPCQYVSSGQSLFPGETLSAKSSTVIIKGTGRLTPSFTCQISSPAEDVIYPPPKGSAKSVVVLQLKKGSTSCLASEGPVRSKRKANALFIAGKTAITIKSQPSTRKNTTNQRSTSAVFTVGETTFTVKGNPVFGMTTTATGPKAGTLIQLTRGQLSVAAANGKRRSLGKNQQVFVPAAPNAPARFGTFTQPAANLQPALCKLTPDLRETNNKFTFTGGDPKGHPLGLAPDSSGNIWFTDDGINAIGKYDLSAHKITYDLNPGSSPKWITAGPNDTLWFTDIGSGPNPQPAIGMLNPKTSKIEEFFVGDSNRKPWAIAYDRRDKNLWFTDPSRNGQDPAIGMLDPATGAITLYRQGLNHRSDPQGIAVDAKGRLWFTDDNDPQPAIGMLDPTVKSPRVTEWPTGIAGSLPRGITAGQGKDSNLYFADDRTVLSTNGRSKAGAAGDGLIGVIDTTTANPQITEFSIADNGGDAGSVPEGLAADLHGNVWFTDDGTTVKTIGMIDPITGAVIEANQSGTGMTGESAPIGILLISTGGARGLWFTDQLPNPRVGLISAKASC